MKPMGFLREEDIERMKETTIGELILELEDALINAGTLSGDMTVFEFIKDYLKR